MIRSILLSAAVTLGAAAAAAPAAAREAAPVPLSEQTSSAAWDGAGRGTYSRDDEPPLLFGRDFEVGGYFSLDVAHTRMFGRDGALVGLQGALLLDHRLSVGLAGYGWTNPQPGPPDAFGNDQRFETGYGGVTLRYSLYAPGFPVYLTLGALVGGGAIVLEHAAADDDFDRDANADTFAVFQPDLAIHGNLTRWLRLGLTAGYRFTSGVDRNGYEESDVDGWVLGGHVQVGRF